jgi:hypothetical protein
MSCYSKEYLEQYDVVEKSWREDHYDNAKKLRDREARRLRKNGWKVETQKLYFADLDGIITYYLFAEREKNKCRRILGVSCN